MMHYYSQHNFKNRIIFTFVILFFGLNRDIKIYLSSENMLNLEIYVINNHINNIYS